MAIQNLEALLAQLEMAGERTFDLPDRTDGRRELYARFVGIHAKDMGSRDMNLMHMAVGISGEAGELLDAVKKLWAYKKPLNIANVIEELGDLEFYMQGMRLLLGISRQQVLEANFTKLKARYHTGEYSDAQAQERADKKEEVDLVATKQEVAPDQTAAVNFVPKAAD